MEEEVKTTETSQTFEKNEKKKRTLKEFFSCWIKDNYNKIFIAVLIVAFLLRLWIFFKTMNQPLWWDEADYLSASKKWGLGLSFQDIWYYRRGFLFPLLGALFFKLSFGEIGMRLVEVLFSTGIVAVSYFLIKKMFDKKLALVTSIALAFSWVALFFTGRVLTDIPAAFFVLLALLFFWKGYALKEGNKYLYFFGISFALAILTRMQSFMFAPVFFVYIFIKEKAKMFKNKQLWITFGIFSLILIPQFVLYALHYGNPLTDILSHYFGISGVSATEPIQRTASTLFSYFKDMPYILTASIFVLFVIGLFLFFSNFILGIDKLFKNEEVQKKFFIILWISIPLLVLGYITDYVEHRYAMAALPFLFLIAVYALLAIPEFLKKHNSALNSKFALPISIIILLFFLTISLGNVYSNLSWANDLTENKLASYVEIQQAGEWIKQNSDASALVITQSRPQITYYSEHSVQSSDSRILENETFFEEGIKELNPEFLVLSSYEQSPDWLYQYPEKHPDALTTVKVFPEKAQPMVVIYQFAHS